MILHALELWLMIALCFLLGCLIGSLVYRTIGLTGLASTQSGTIHTVDRVLRVIEWRILPWRSRAPVRLPRVASIPPPDFRPIPFEESSSAEGEGRPRLPAGGGENPAPIAHAELVGARPLPLAGPRHGVADDLAAIKGLGKRHAAKLASVGIFHFSQIASWTPQEIAWISAFLGIGDTIVAKDWVGQAIRVAGSDNPAEAALPVRKAPKQRSRRGRAKKQAAEIDPAGELGPVIESASDESVDEGRNL
jgi:NADH-quinone oxidoreductase subunit E